METAPRFRKPVSVTGKELVFRDAVPADAAFILGLRTDEKKNRYLSSTSPELDKQVAWLERYAQDDEQIYFIIENRQGEAVGTVRLYDRQGASFCWGSWIKKDGAPSGFGIESASMIYHYALSLGFTAAHFDVRKLNKAVCQFHERFGAVVTGETELDYFYSIDAAAIGRTLDKYRKFLPDGIRVVS